MDAEPELSCIQGSPRNAVFQTVKYNCEMCLRNFLLWPRRRSKKTSTKHDDIIYQEQKAISLT